MQPRMLSGQWLWVTIEAHTATKNERVRKRKRREPRPAFADRGSLTLATSYSRTT